ncbi:MAG: triphosphoribosyl-dephospho-CoA synthase [Halanaeroarchaeum sp.]
MTVRRSRAQRAQLALLLEVAGTPKPGNVDRHRDYPDLRFEHFLAGAIGAHEGLQLAAEGERVGRAFERAVSGMSQQEAGNTQFGALLLLAPLVRAAADGDLSPEGVHEAVEATTVADAADFYRAFDHVDVAVADPPEAMDDLDVRRGSDAVEAVEESEVTLYDVMERSAERDGLAREWVGGFERTFRAAGRIAELDGPVPERAAETFLELLAAEPDTFVAIQHDEETAEEVRERAEDALVGRVDPDEFADELVDRNVNPGTTADLVAGALFVALERGVSV